MSRNRNTFRFDVFAVMLGLFLAVVFTLAVIATINDCANRDNHTQVRGLHQ